MGVSLGLRTKIAAVVAITRMITATTPMRAVREALCGRSSHRTSVIAGGGLTLVLLRAGLTVGVGMTSEREEPLAAGVASAPRAPAAAEATARLSSLARCSRANLAARA